MENEKVSVFDVVTDRIIKALEAGTVPWRQSWDINAGPPRNLVSGKEYQGINWLVLQFVGRSFGSPYWLTFKQALDMGGNVRKGEKGTPVMFWKIYDGKTDKDKRFVARYYTVFNATQCDGIEAPAGETAAHVHTPIEACESLVSGYKGPEIRHGGDRACYSPIGDAVTMPDKTQFDAPEHYYSVLFHELTHSTGHESRLKRFDNTAPMASFGSADYSKEELVAEMGSAFLCAYTRIDNSTIEDSAAYIASWLKVLRTDKRAVVSAASAAQKAANMIIGETDSDESVSS